MIYLFNDFPSCHSYVKLGTGADSGPDVFNDFYLNHSSSIGLKLWRRDDLLFCLELEMVFSSNVTLGICSLIIEYWATMGYIICKCRFGKRK